MKFPPLVMFRSDVDYFHGLPDLATMSHFSVDDPGRIHVQFHDVRPQTWPEGTEYSGFILMGDAGTQSIHCAPRTPKQAMQRTPKAFASRLAGSLDSSLFMKFHPQPAATRQPATRRLAVASRR
jgi:hypothetical protein